LRGLAEYREAWREALLTLAGDEESMGPLGTKWLLDNVPGLARADGVIIGDAGSPRVLRFGEKGFVWINLRPRAALPTVPMCIWATTPLTGCALPWMR
jgi:hypothetical protein